MRCAAAANPTGPAPMIAIGNSLGIFPFVVGFPTCVSNVPLVMYLLPCFSVSVRIYKDGAMAKRTHRMRVDLEEDILQNALSRVWVRHASPDEVLEWDTEPLPELLARNGQAVPSFPAQPIRSVE